MPDAVRIDHAPPPLPGGVGLTFLRVYDTLAPDGLAGGSPHMHLACTECYYVVRGAGAVQTLCPSGFAETPLDPGAVVWFTPGVIHRLINHGNLEIFVVMQNSGLPERGDFVLAMPPDILADPRAYAEASCLSAAGDVAAGSLAAAYRRRDLAVQGFAEMRQAFDTDGAVALERFYRAAGRLIASRIDSWERIWRAGPLREAEQTGRHLRALAAGDMSHLRSGKVMSILAREPTVHGMCGLLSAYLPEGVAQGAGEEKP